MREPFYITYSDQDRRNWSYGKAVWWVRIRIVTVARRDSRDTVVVAATLQTMDNYIGKLHRTAKIDVRARPKAKLLSRRRGAIFLEDITRDDVRFLGLHRLGPEITAGAYAMRNRMVPIPPPDIPTKRRQPRPISDFEMRWWQRRSNPLGAGDDATADTKVKPDPNWRPPEEREDLGPTLFERLTKRL